MLPSEPGNAPLGRPLFERFRGVEKLPCDAEVKRFGKKGDPFESAEGVGGPEQSRADRATSSEVWAALAHSGRERADLCRCV